ncbi:MAG: hypothetical protein QM737_05655 [Ferruginibacter sp.]
MKHFFLALFMICGLVITTHAQSQLPDTCKVTGYFFNNNTPTSSRAINMVKAITQVAPNRYEVILGDLTTLDYRFQFDINANNQLVNWVAMGAAATNVPAPASGFMTQDDPGLFFLGEDPAPGYGGWDIFAYNNTYDSATHTIYMHYGYGVGSTNESGYTRQVYEKYVLPAPHVYSFTPTSGTSLTEVTIRGKYFSDMDSTGYNSTVVFGTVTADSFAVVSDTILKAWLGFGTTGKIKVYKTAGSDSSADAFTYTAPALPVIDTQWRYLGTAGFSDYRATWANIACGSNDVPYVVYRDSLTGRAIVKKFDGNNWANVGSFASDGNCAMANIALDNSNNPIVIYQDSTNNNNLTVKKFNGSSWANVGAPGFAIWNPYTRQTAIIANDGANNLYTMSVDTFMEPTGNSIFKASVYKFNGSSWSVLGAADFVHSYQSVIDLAVDKLTNTPYVVYDIFPGMGGSWAGQASVQKFNGSSWVQVGQTRITTDAWRGTFYNNIAIDQAGVPYIAVQDDNGFERESVFKFSGTSWVPVGSPRFSHGHAYNGSLAFDTSKNPIILYRDYSYNRSGSVLKYDNAGSWNYLGARGVIPSQAYDKNALAVDSHNTPLVVFADYWHGGKISVMIFKPARFVNDSLCANGNITLHSDNSNAGNTYRWQGNNGSGFTNLVNNATYNGVSTNTLNIQSAPSSYYGYQYRCIIQNGVGIDTGFVHTIHFANMWTGAVSTAWENPANWSCNVVPDANTDVIINSGTVVVSSNPIIRTLTLEPTVVFTVSTGFNLTITH